VIGINLWLVPQISEHWPTDNPGRLDRIVIWFIRPGVASILTPSDGIVHEWITSVEDARIRMGVFIGITRWLDDSSRRVNKFFFDMNESYFNDLKSEYSYLQNHWWPIVLIVKFGIIVSSIM